MSYCLADVLYRAGPLIQRLMKLKGWGDLENSIQNYLERLVWWLDLRRVSCFFKIKKFTFAFSESEKKLFSPNVKSNRLGKI